MSTVPRIDLAPDLPAAAPSEARLSAPRLLAFAGPAVPISALAISLLAYIPTF
ncbi:hypothetical protein [Sphingomonas glacialis]|uniref:hypothetical protein n=1 Tax=Sphingomonas glacialis TaxID=658225 RepID=UPI001F4F5D8B|nr:hypothetical protein [Sphingomonas glacialis]